MTLPEFVFSWLKHYRDIMSPDRLEESLSAALKRIRAVRGSGKKLLFAGNGASATIASHYALDFTKQGGVRSLAFNDAAIVTAYGNDYGYEAWVARALEHHGESGDVAVLISSSGESPNIVAAAQQCRAMGIDVLGFSGFSPENTLNDLSDVSFWADSRGYNVVEAVHAMWLGILCDLLIGEREYGVTN